MELLPSLLQKRDAAFKIVLPAFLGMLLAGMCIANLPGPLPSLARSLSLCLCLSPLYSTLIYYISFTRVITCALHVDAIAIELASHHITS